MAGRATLTTVPSRKATNDASAAIADDEPLLGVEGQAHFLNLDLAQDSRAVE